MTEQSGLDWIERTAERIEQLEELNLKDRLACYVALWRFVEAIGDSVSGWRSWLVRPSTVADFSEQESQDFCVDMREMAVQFLKFYVKATEKFKLPPGPAIREPERRYRA